VEWHAKLLYQFVDPADKKKGVSFKVDKAVNVTAASSKRTRGATSPRRGEAHRERVRMVLPPSTHGEGPGG
jgi:hypothetical protein